MIFPCGKHHASRDSRSLAEIKAQLHRSSNASEPHRLGGVFVISVQAGRFSAGFQEVLTDLFCVIAVGLADEPDGIRQQDVALRFLRFVLLPLFVFLVCDLLYGGYLAFWSID